MTDVRLRPVEPGDAAALLALLADAWRAGEGAGSATSPWIDAYAASCVDEFLVAAIDGRVVGVVHAYGGVLLALQVAEGFRRRGVGRRLLATAEADGAVRLEVAADNLAAQRFYRDCGWREAGEAVAGGRPVIAMVRSQ